jgi:hypothetical protein
MVTHSAETAADQPAIAELMDLFGTVTLPLPWKDLRAGSKIQADLRRLNPGATVLLSATAAEKKAAAEAKEAAELAAYEAARRNTTEGKARAYTRDMLEGGEGYNPYYR